MTGSRYAALISLSQEAGLKASTQKYLIGSWSSCRAPYCFKAILSVHSRQSGVYDMRIGGFTLSELRVAAEDSESSSAAFRF